MTKKKGLFRWEGPHRGKGGITKVIVNATLYQTGEENQKRRRKRERLISRSEK